MKRALLLSVLSPKTLASAGAFALRGGVTLSLVVIGTLAASAQSGQQQISVYPNPVDSIQQLTIVPVQRPPVQIVEHTTLYEESTKGMDRVERRAYRAKVYAAKIDSLVQSRDYMFFPNSMQQRPKGMIRMVVANYFFFGFFVDRVEVHLPTERGLTQYVNMLNFSTMAIRDYRALRVPWGWSVSMNVTDGDTLYHVDMAVSTSTGETILTLVTPAVSMRYVGWLWNKRIDDPKFSRLD